MIAAAIEHLERVLERSASAAAFFAEGGHGRENVPESLEEL